MKFQLKNLHGYKPSYASALLIANRWQQQPPIDCHFESVNKWIWEYHQIKYSPYVHRGISKSSAAFSLVRDNLSFLRIIIASYGNSWAF